MPPPSVTSRSLAGVAQPSGLTAASRLGAPSGRRGGPDDASGPAKWRVDSDGNIVNFDMKILRQDILYRLRSGHDLYTTEECKVFLTEMIRTATLWQEEELSSLLFLQQMHHRLLPGHQTVFQWPVAHVAHVPFAPPVDPLHDTPLYRATRVVEELNRSLVRMIDRLWNERRERLLLAAAMLEGIEKVAGSV